VRRPHICAALAILGALAFAPTLRNNFVGYDDREYVIENPHVNTGLTPSNAAWAFTAVHSNNWHPLTWLSHQLDCTLFGLDPAGPHAINLLLHIANTLLLFWWLADLTGDSLRAAFAAAVFGVHPVHVESVAWIAERKDVLSTLFGLFALLAYTRYARKPAVWRYLAVAGFFALSLLAKQMLVTLPLLLLLLDWWPLKRGWSVKEKLPLVGISVAASAVAVLAQRSAIAPIDALPLDLRLSNAAVS